MLPVLWDQEVFFTGLTSFLDRTYKPGACEKVVSDLRLGGGFRMVLWYPPPVTAG